MTEVPLGLRERKKAKMRAAIQQEALRLFREQGYDTTTVEDICRAAEVSPSTFFRYFPTKEDAVLYDILDPVIISMFKAQPANLSPVEAIRRSFRETLASLSTEEQSDQQDRARLFLSVPQLRDAWMGQLAEQFQLLSGLLADRLGRRPDDFAVRNLSGAIIGTLLGAMLCACEDPSTDLLSLVDPALAHLEAGLPL